MLLNRKLWLCILLAAGAVSHGAELLPNRDFSKSVNGVPAGWTFQKSRSNPVYKLLPAEGKTPASVKIVTGKNGSGFVTCELLKEFPAGTNVTISGEYRTEDISFSKNGNILTNLVGRFDLKKDKQPRYWLNHFLNPAEKWTKFHTTGRIKSPV